MAKYTDEFKDTILKLYQSGKSLAELNREYGVPKSTISTWVKDNSKIVLNSSDDMTIKELRSLKKELSQIKEENEILKKAMAILAKK